jgi:DNA-binding PadR family transcriptional regulator
LEQLDKVADSWRDQMRRGYTKLAVLALLHRESLTGYDIMKKIDEKTLGFWRLTTGGVYPVLKELEENNYIIGDWESKSGRRKKVYKLTNGGEKLLTTALHKQQQMEKTMRNLFQEFARDILNLEIISMPMLDGILSVSPLARGMEEKNVAEQIKILRHIRTNILTALKFVDEKLQKLETSK